MILFSYSRDFLQASLTNMKTKNILDTMWTFLDFSSEDFEICVKLYEINDGVDLILFRPKRGVEIKMRRKVNEVARWDNRKNK